MPQSFAQIYVHIIFSTKNRAPFLKDATVRKRLHAYLANICRRRDSPPEIVGGPEDHVHILCRLGRTTTVAELVIALKTGSSKWVKQEGSSSFRWQSGYGAFSCRNLDVPVLRTYIANQMEHHRRLSFKDELRQMLADHGVDFNELFIWD